MNDLRDDAELASELGLPVIIHSREAAAETYAVLRDWLAEGPRPEEPVGVLHCFSGDLAAAQRYVDMGFMISVAGNVTYPNATRLQAVAATLPLEHLIVETDCPFLAPQSHRGGRCELLLPYATLEPIRKMLLQNFMGEKFGRDSIWESHLAREIWHTDLELEAVRGDLAAAGDDGHLLAVPGVPGDRRLDGALRRLRYPLH